MDFSAADDKSGGGAKSFIAELMPRFPIYTDFLTEEAREVIGRAHAATEPARRMLEQEGIATLALDLDPDRVHQARAAGQAVAYGDATKAPTLTAAGLARASAVVLTYLDTAVVLKTLATIRALAPHTPVIVRTQTDRDLERLRAAGATEVVPESQEGSLMLAGHALALVGVPMRRVIHIVQQYREQRYGLLRGYFHGADDVHEDELEAERLATLTVPPAAAGQRLADIGVSAVYTPKDFQMARIMDDVAHLAAAHRASS
mgnify:CR=1 FL=1